MLANVPAACLSVAATAAARSRGDVLRLQEGRISRTEEERGQRNEPSLPQDRDHRPSEAQRLSVSPRQACSGGVSTQAPAAHQQLNSVKFS